MMVGTVEVSSNVVLHIPPSNDPEVCLEPIHEGASRLAYILFLASFASDAVDQIVALAGHVTFTDKRFLRVATGDPATQVQ